MHYNTATGTPNINAVTIGTDTLEMGQTGANPLVFPQSLSPNIKTNLSITYQDSTPGQVCYSGSMYGNQFPNSEAFVVNSKSQEYDADYIHYSWRSERRANPVPAVRWYE